MNEITFRSWPQRRKWCLNTFSKNALSWSFAGSQGDEEASFDTLDDITLIGGAGSFRKCIADEDPFFQIRLLE